jgi:hypothetical protein
MRPLPAVLLDLHEDFATGKLVLKRGRSKASTWSTAIRVDGRRRATDAGSPASSGVITETHRSKWSAPRSRQCWEALVALKVMTVEQLIDQLGRQARHKIVQALRWPQGAWRFEEGPGPIEGMQLRMVEVVLGGLKETSVEDVGRLSRLDGLSFESSAASGSARAQAAYGERASRCPDGADAEIERAFKIAPGPLAVDA